MALLTIESLNFAYPKSEFLALSDINLCVEEGSFVLLCGESGCGKTTLLRHLKNEMTPHGTKKGNVVFDGKEVSEMDTLTSAKQIGYVMQNIDNQVVTDKVYSELAFGLESLGLSNEVIRRRIAEMASFFGIQNWFRAETSKLSGGQKQMLNLASIMVMQPKLLILDEPTSQLDPIAAAEFLNTIVRINKNLGTTVVITEHRLEEVFPYADTVVAMDGGQIIDCGAPREVAQRLSAEGKKHIISEAFPAATRIYAGVSDKCEQQCPLTVNEGRTFVKNLVVTTGIVNESEKQQISVANKRHKTDEVVRLNEVFFRYEKNAKDILRGLNLAVNRGEIYCVLGGNGTGKTTMLNIIGGLYSPYRGNVQILGKKQDKYKNGELYGGILSALPQNPYALFSNKTVMRELEDITTDAVQINEVIEIMKINALLGQHPYDLSGGEQQKVAFAKVLLCNPQIILLDEPTKGLDAHYKKGFGELLKKLVKEGKTIIMATHDIEFAATYGTKCCLFFDGEISSEGKAKQFFAGNYFYTTAANRIARAMGSSAICVEEILKELQ